MVWSGNHKLEKLKDKFIEDHSKELSQAEVTQNFDAMKGRFEQRPLILSGISYSLT